ALGRHWYRRRCPRRRGRGSHPLGQEPLRRFQSPARAVYPGLEGEHPMENEELIRKQMEETRTSLTEKLETLEEQVVGAGKDTSSAVTGTAGAVKDTVSTVKDSVQDTVSTVKDTVTETVTAVKDTVQEGVETVKSWLDLKAHTEKHPWMVMGGSVLLGYFL